MNNLKNIIVGNQFKWQIYGVGTTATEYTIPHLPLWLPHADFNTQHSTIFESYHLYGSFELGMFSVAKFGEGAQTFANPTWFCYRGMKALR